MLIVDCCGYASLSLNESAGGVTRFTGKFQEANTPNKNKRVYPFDVLDKNVEKLKETIENRGLYGELDHASDSIIHLANASHLITKLWWEGNCLMGTGEILNTPAGKVLKSLIDGGGRIGVSSRGVGNGQMNNEGLLQISPSYNLLTFDVVADPSVGSAFQSKVTNKRESVEPQPAKLNTKALISFFGHALQGKMSEIKSKL